MPCATADEVHLVKTYDAVRYAPAGSLCSAECRQALVWFDWETLTSKALYEILRHLETALRSAVSGRLTEHFGREDWWNDRGLTLTYDTQDKIRKAERQARARVQKSGEVLTAAGIQRELTLGFWVSLVGSGADYETQLWRPMRSAFPGYVGVRWPLYEQLNHLRILRNKVAHQEPIGGRRLDQDRRSVLQCIGYVSQAASRRVAAADTETVRLLAQRPGCCPRIAGGRA